MMVKKVISDELLDLMIADLELYKKRGVHDPWILTDGTQVEPLSVLRELRERRGANKILEGEHKSVTRQISVGEAKRRQASKLDDGFLLEGE